MPYSPAQIVEIDEGQITALENLQNAQFQILQASDLTSEPVAKEYLLHGVGRRMSVLRRTLENIFELFPASSHQLLDRTDLGDIGINLHAFLINLVGVLENFAWVYVWHHKIAINKGSVSLFSPKLQALLPTGVHDYVNTDRVRRWYDEYVNNYRDALAHRIPPYLPPGVVPPQHGERLAALQEMQLASIGTDRYEQIEEERKALAEPCFEFAHSVIGNSQSRRLLLHPQIIADANLVAEFSGVFLANWLESPRGIPFDQSASTSSAYGTDMRHMIRSVIAVCLGTVGVFIHAVI